MKTCQQCGGAYARRAKEAYVQYESRRYCGRRCAGLAANPRKPAVEFAARYRKVNTPDGRNMLEHRYVMEQHIGRPLRSDEQVHHINHDGLDNRIENLELVSIAEHAQRHTWRPLTSTCEVCGSEFTPHKTKRGIKRTCGKPCAYKLRWLTRRQAVTA
jgi:hypothetical protein